MDQRESLTILLSTILAVEGWLFTHLLDQINASPILEYQIKESIESSSANKTTIQLQNLNHRLSFKSVEVVLVAAPGSTINRAFLTPVEPASDIIDEMIVTNNSASFTIDNMMSKSIIRTTIEFSGRRPSLRISSPNQPIFLAKPSVETFISRNQSILLLVMMPITIFIGYLAFFLMEKRGGRTPAKKTRSARR